MKAIVKRGGKDRVEVTQKRGEWNNDRQAFETRDLVVDRDANRYIQHWRDATTEESMFLKDDPLKNRRAGRDSYRPTSPRPPTLPA